jgi:hypothetical protein
MFGRRYTIKLPASRLLGAVQGTQDLTIAVAAVTHKQHKTANTNITIRRCVTWHAMACPAASMCVHVSAKRARRDARSAGSIHNA